MKPSECFCLPNSNNDVFLYDVDFFSNINEFNLSDSNKKKIHGHRKNRFKIKPLILDGKFMLYC
jgi:hypothetical protein